jgi:tetratricopeptide (TPR) repeat protein
MLYYQDVKDTTKALEYFEQSLSIRELLGNQLGMAVVLANIGNIYRDRKQLFEAYERYGKALRISEAIGYKEGIVRTNYYIAIAHQKNNEFKESNQYLNSCLKMATQYGMKNYYQIVNEAKLKNFAALGDYTGFMEEFKVYSATKDTLSNELNELKTKESEARYKIEELIPELDRLELLNKHQDQLLLLYRSVLAFVVLAIIVLGILWMFKSKKKAN